MGGFPQERRESNLVAVYAEEMQRTSRDSSACPGSEDLSTATRWRLV